MPDEEQNKGDKGTIGVLDFKPNVEFDQYYNGVGSQRGFNTLHKLVEQFVPTLLVFVRVLWMYKGTYSIMFNADVTASGCAFFNLFMYLFIFTYFKIGA